MDHRIRLAATACFAAWALVGPATGQEAFVPDDPELFEVQTQRLHACADFVITRDPSRIDAAGVETLGEYELPDAVTEDVEVEYGRAFADRAEDGWPERTVSFFAGDLGFSRTKAGCHLEVKGMTNHDAEGLARMAIRDMAASFPVALPLEEQRRRAVVAFCTPSERPLQLTIRYRDDDSIAGLTIEDVMQGPFSGGTYRCAFEPAE